jgi:hypothetical protein
MFLLSTKLSTVLDFRVLYKSLHFNINLYFSTCCMYFQWKIAGMIFLKLIYECQFCINTESRIYHYNSRLFICIFFQQPQLRFHAPSSLKLCKAEVFTPIINSRILFLEVSFATTLNFARFENAS